MSFVDAEKNTMLDAITASHAALHTDIPLAGDSVEHEVTGGSYARQVITFAAAATGQKAKSGGSLSFPVPAATEVFFAGLYDALTVGNLLAYFPINDGDIDGVGDGLASGDIINSSGHGLADNDRVILKAPVGSALPVGVDANTIYHVVGAVTNVSFQVALTQGGAAVTITVNGQVYFQRVTPESFGGAGTLSLDTMILKLEE